MHQFKFICTALALSTMIVATSVEIQPVKAGTCASNYGPLPLQFTPGQRILIEVVNNTKREVKLQKPFVLGTVSLKAGEQMLLEQGDGTIDNA